MKLIQTYNMDKSLHFPSHNLENVTILSHVANDSPGEEAAWDSLSVVFAIHQRDVKVYNDRITDTVYCNEIRCPFIINSMLCDQSWLVNKEYFVKS